MNSTPCPTLRLVLGDQLSESLPTLQRADKARDIVLLCEVAEEATYVKHHPKKIAFLFSAMRHFAEHLRARGYRVDYIRLEDAENTGSFDGEVARALARHHAAALEVTEPGEWRVLEKFHHWQQSLGVPVTILPDSRFLCSREEFSQWAKGKRSLRMEFFYRDMRKRYGLLMEMDGNPAGGQWNYDAENRKPPKEGLRFPPRPHHTPDSITADVLKRVAERFGKHFGALEPFGLAVTREQALADLDHFITRLLPRFGDYQDAMLAEEAFLYHSLLSTSLNAGLLLPLEICQRAEAAWHKGTAPLNAVEGFIRQILGWREFIRGIYWHHMPDYAEKNTLNATRPLPDFYWTGQTEMNCLAHAIEHTRKHAYSHHIQRLMVTGNFALLAGLDVKQVCEWYLCVYADAYEWVELPNTLGMALHGDGGIVGSKPYAASGKYIDRMSNYCEGCRYSPKETVGEKACPFNALYWHFLWRHREKFARNPRMAAIYKNFERMDERKRLEILRQAERFLERLEASPAYAAVEKPQQGQLF